MRVCFRQLYLNDKYLSCKFYNQSSRMWQQHKSYSANLLHKRDGHTDNFRRYSVNTGARRSYARSHKCIPHSDSLVRARLRKFVRKFPPISSTCSMARRVVMMMGAVATAMAINPGASSYTSIFNQIRTCFGRVATALAIYPGTSCCRLLLCQQTRSRLFHALPLDLFSMRLFCR